MSRTRILVAVSAVLFAAFGLLGLFDPLRVLEMIHVQPKDVTAVGEARAMYGGVQLAVAAFLAACLMNRWSLEAGLFLATAIYTGAAAARAKSMVVDGMPDSLFVGVWLCEITLAVLGVLALRRGRD